jgi:acetolactate synthase-1/2/3 large subunit
MSVNRETASVLSPYDVGALARATGCRYFRVLRDGELDTVLPHALAAARRGLPALVEVAIDYSRKTYFTDGVVKNVFSLLPASDRIANVLRAVKRRLF